MEANRLSGLVMFWRLLCIHGRLDVAWVARDIGQLVAFYFADLITSTAAVLATLLLAQRFDGIGPWNRDQVLFMLAYGLLARGVLEVFFSYNIAFVSRRIGRGQLDHSLLQPHPLWVTFLTEGFRPLGALGEIGVGVATMGVAIAHVPIDLTPLWMVAFAANLVASAAIILAFSYLVGSLAFWAPAPAEEMSMASMEVFSALKSFPLDGAGTLLLGGLLWVLPVGFVAWVPSRELLGLDPSVLGLVATPIAALALAGLSACAFRKGLNHYGHTGSQRYSTFGFRR